MRVILFRHGPAGERDPKQWPDDAERPLTQKGIARTRAASVGLAGLLEDVNVIATSPLVRAAQTAKLLADVMRGKPVIETIDELRPGQPPRAILKRLSEASRRHTIVLVGHEPDLGQLAGFLAFQTPAPLTLKKAGACSIAFEEAPKAGSGRIEWLLTPRLLRRLGAVVEVST
jgi:phosphohistidine phosphatase